MLMVAVFHTYIYISIYLYICTRNKLAVSLFCYYAAQVCYLLECTLSSEVKNTYLDLSQNGD